MCKSSTLAYKLRLIFALWRFNANPLSCCCLRFFLLLLSLFVCVCVFGLTTLVAMFCLCKNTICTRSNSTWTTNNKRSGLTFLGLQSQLNEPTRRQLQVFCALKLKQTSKHIKTTTNMLFARMFELVLTRSDSFARAVRPFNVISQCERALLWSKQRVMSTR